MLDPSLAPIAGWDSFYVIVGSSGGALIGLQFVVIALAAEAEINSSHATIRAFATPTIVHFGSALLISTIMSAPWQSLTSVSWALRVIGLCGVAYALLTMWRARNQEGYTPVWEDWLWHGILPFVAYGMLFAGGYEMLSHEGGALFGIAGIALLLLFIGIHNAWDTVIFIVLDNPRRDRAAPASSPTSDGNRTT